MKGFCNKAFIIWRTAKFQKTILCSILNQFKELSNLIYINLDTFKKDFPQLGQLSKLREQDASDFGRNISHLNYELLVQIRARIWCGGKVRSPKFNSQGRWCGRLGWFSLRNKRLISCLPVWDWFLENSRKYQIPSPSSVWVWRKCRILTLQFSRRRWIGLLWNVSLRRK